MWSIGSGCAGFTSCSTCARSVVVALGSAAPQHVKSPQNRDRMAGRLFITGPPGKFPIVVLSKWVNHFKKLLKLNEYILCCCCCSVSKSCLTLCNPMNCSSQASLSITNSRSLLKLKSIRSAMLSNHLIFCHPLLLLPSIFPSIRVFFSKSDLSIR